MVNIITSEHKEIFNATIDHLISKEGLGTPCLLSYNSNITSKTDCNNCLIDPIYKQSMGKYNGTGPRSFPDGAVCPECNGQGFLSINNSEIIYMAVLVSEKTWIDIGGIEKAQIPAGSVQTISKSDTFNKIMNSYSMSISDQNGINNNLAYQRHSDPTYVGFGSHNYLITIWKKIL
jgi:hypothetical protein